MDGEEPMRKRPRVDAELYIDNVHSPAPPDGLPVIPPMPSDVLQIAEQVTSHRLPADHDLDLDEEAYDLLEATSSGLSLATEVPSSESLVSTTLPVDGQAGCPYVTITKRTLKEIVPKSRYEVLPDGWIAVTHDSGMPIYLHRGSRVCTLARPYFVGPSSVRKHHIPTSAIPCLMYKRAKEKLSETNGSAVVNSDAYSDENTTSAAGSDCTVTMTNGDTPDVEIKTGHALVESLDPDAVTQYCSNVFDFETVEVKKFKTWKEKRIHLNQEERPKPTSGAVVIPVDSLPSENRIDHKGSLKDDLIVNPVGKPMSVILGDYVMWAMRRTPAYEVLANESSGEAYKAIAKIDDVVYGTGSGSSKRAAKDAAAHEVLRALIPVYIEKIEELMNFKSKGNSEVTKFFDTIKVLDTRIFDLSKQLNQPTPYNILTTCLARNYIISHSDIKSEITVVKNNVIECVMTVGSYNITVRAKNSKSAKHLAAQHIVQKLHPQVTCWGSILRLYGHNSEGSTVSNKKAKMEQLEVTSLQNKKDEQSGSSQVLAKLKQHLLAVYKERGTNQNKRKFEQRSKILPLHQNHLNMYSESRDKVQE